MKVILTHLLTRIPLAVGAVVAFGLPGAHAGTFANPEPVVIEGYGDHAMEPFLSRDGRILLFNNRNGARDQTDLHWAERITPVRFSYRGRIAGANSKALDGVPSLDRTGLLYFVSTRSYQKTLSTIFRARFSNGRASGVALVEGVSLKMPGKINFDAEISADGARLYAVDGVFGRSPPPRAANIFVARRVDDRFVRDPASAEIMKHINTSALEYAPAISSDGLEIFFTRMSGILFWRKVAIWHATRLSRDGVFGQPTRIKAIRGFVEAPTISPDGRSLYYHKKVKGVHRIYRVTRP
jgi:WD40-like Beta Propeller Repeat